MKPFLLCIGMCFSGLIFASAQETITINFNQPGISIPQNFIGLSFEAELSFHNNYFTPSDTTLLNYFQTAGVKVLRLGGNTVEDCKYYPGVTRHPNPFDTVIPSELDSLFAFAKLAGCQVMLGLNFGGDFNPSLYAKEASYVMQHYFSQLLAFEIGNEPNLYSRNGLRDTSYSYSDYQSQFSQYVDSIWHYYPNAPISGPTTALDGWTWANYDLPFCQDMKDTISLLTQHYYGAPTFVAPIGQEILNMLSPQVKDSLISLVDTLVQCATSDSIPFRMSECNSTSVGPNAPYKSGEWGVSNSFGDALWGLDYMYTLLQHGAVGVNFHTVFGSSSCAISDSNGVYSARPLYYAMMAFNLTAGDAGGVGGDELVPLQLSGNAQNLSAYAVKYPFEWEAYITIINKDTLNAVPVSVMFSFPDNFDVAQQLTLTAPTVSDTFGYTLGDSVVHENGVWNEPGWYELPVHKTDTQTDTILDTIPSASAVIISLDFNTGINRVTAKGASLSVYPNPTDDLLSIKCSSPLQKITVYNMLGQVMLENITPVDTKLVTENVSQLPLGVYTIQSTLSNNVVANSMFVKQ